MKPFYLLWCTGILLLPAGLASAQQAQGTVYAHDSLPLPGSAITNIRNHVTILSDPAGRFVIAALPGDTLLIQALGHLPSSVTVRTGALRIYLYPKIEQLAGVEIRQRKRRVDSLEDRENFRAGFNFRRPKFREVVLITPTGIGVNIHKLYKALSFSNNRSKATFRRRLIEYEQAQFTGERFSDSLVARYTGFRGDSLIFFINRYPPSYKFALEASDYDFIRYIRQAADSFRLGLNRYPGPR